MRRQKQLTDETTTTSTTTTPTTATDETVHLLLHTFFSLSLSVRFFLVEELVSLSLSLSS